jgi:hypothetical protein
MGVVPEPLHYLIEKEKHKTVFSILAKAYAQGDFDGPNRDRIQRSPENNGDRSIICGQWTHWTLENTRKLALLTALDFTEWSGNGMASCYMTDVLNAA